jgi:hypothetical protein
MFFLWFIYGYYHLKNVQIVIFTNSVIFKQEVQMMMTF